MKKLATKAMIAVVCIVCAWSHAPAQEAKPDTVLLNGKIFTGVASHPYVEALAIRGDRIVATGDTKTIKAMAGPKTNAIDLHGATAIPGINDAHHHFELGPPEVDVDLHAMDPSWAQVKDGIVAAIAKNPPNSLIAATIGMKVFSDPSINRDTLDQIAPHNPVSLGTFTGHGVILNTAGLRFYDIPENQRDPMGGRFERDAKGRLTGTLREYADDEHGARGRRSCSGQRGDRATSAATGGGGEVRRHLHSGAFYHHGAVPCRFLVGEHSDADSRTRGAHAGNHSGRSR